MKQWIPFLKKTPKVAVVRLSGVIASSGRGRLNDAGIGPVLERAFKKGKPDAVALILNSPGGSPAQSSLIAARIQRLAQENDTKVFAFVEDVAASGGYWLACAADEIWVDQSSVVGSIGVISSGFGLDELIAKHGVSRRVYTAGKSKSSLDPFKPENPEDLKRLEGYLSQLHEIFIDHVQTRRSGKLSGEADLFNGEIWIGQKAAELGLVDGVGHLVPKMKEHFGEKVQFMKYGQKKGLFQRFGAEIVHDAIAGIEERAEYARFGL
ncbi:S49 family peptidase [Cochlodiniinecator piscidefendens]|uniref:S49 family peptidase n=1 Tax=Cochlodiniinecator piscidefendens TaxID=2715756 RepID=UPI00140CC1C2|nr:S49 family peptidase [Cochlodiniinecator piscidefendens]